ncbi:DUF4325 domain-containing protein [Kurthia gibsonii]|uniref:STAS-like domain-containing protein n=1 Tax=Kurthia gibsonii TaxID=33946 RepID=UPI000EAED888|nr:STAS-like domain-containing protein [Kurthia gibsonii]RXH52462.1 DUF4325 domain-containing protein [Kurthia gibsonii]
MVEIFVKDIIASETAVAPIKGDILNKVIAEKLYSNETIEVNFEGIEDLTTAFLNKAIGNLYNSFSKDKIEKNIIAKNLDEVDMFLWDKVKERANVKFSKGTETGDDVRRLLGDD